MCRTIHALLTVVICGVQMLVRVFMTLILMIENVIRMFLQTLYNFISFLLQLISLVPICCVFFATSRLKCFMCGGGGPCPVRRGGGCDCLMSAVAIIILFFIFRATGVLDKIFYSIGYAKAAKHVAKYSPTPGTITECSRNDSFVTNATTPQMKPGADGEISSPAMVTDSDIASETLETTFSDDETSFTDDGTAFVDGEKSFGTDETKDEDAEKNITSESTSFAESSSEPVLEGIDGTTKYRVADITSSAEEKEITPVPKATTEQTKPETAPSTTETSKKTSVETSSKKASVETSSAAETTKYSDTDLTTIAEGETQEVTPVPTNIETTITEPAKYRRVGAEKSFGDDDNQIDEETHRNSTKTNEDTIILYYDDDTQIIGNNLTASKNNDDSREIETEEEDMHLSEHIKLQSPKSKISVKATRSSYDTNLEKLKLKGWLGTTSISYYMV